MRRVTGSAGAVGDGRGRAHVWELPASASGSNLHPAGPVALAVDLPDDAEIKGAEDLSSPTAKKLHRRPLTFAAAAAAAARLRALLLGPVARHRRLRWAAAVSMAMVVLLLLVSGHHRGKQPLSGGLPADQEYVRPSVGQPGKRAASRGAGDMPAALKAAAFSDLLGSLLVEFTAPGLYIPLKEALDVGRRLHPQEASLLDAMPLMPLNHELAAMGGRPSLEQVLQQRQRQQQHQVHHQAQNRAHPTAGQAAGVSISTSKLAGDGRSGGSLPPAELANAIQSELQQQEEAARRIRGEEAEAAARAQQQAVQAAAGTPEEQYRAAVADVFRRSEGRQPLQLLGSAAATGGQLGASAGSGGVRMLVAVASACCSDMAARRRAAIRDTWGRAASEHPNVDLRFFLAQPSAEEAAITWLPQLQREVAQHNDTILLRGPDTYINLPNKTLRLLRYAVAHPAGFTHILKTDDDSYVRVAKVLEALQDAEDLRAAATQHRSPAAAGVQGEAGSSGAQGPPRGQLLPGLHRGLMEQVARTGDPLHTDGLSVYNMSQLVVAASSHSWAERKFYDDAEGHAISLAQLAADAAAAAKDGGWQRQALSEGQAATGSGAALRHLEAVAMTAATPSGARMTGVYLGCLENKGGFFPIRDEASKWHMSEEELPDSAVPFAVKYLAGWGYVLSRDLADHAVRKANLWLRQPELAPDWFRPMHWEDVLVALLLMDVVEGPQDHAGFRPAWRSCPSTTVVKHMDVDALQLVRGLHEQDRSGLWDAKPVQCATGDFLPGDYSGWKAWRDRLPSVEHI